MGGPWGWGFVCPFDGYMSTLTLQPHSRLMSFFRSSLRLDYVLVETGVMQYRNWILGPAFGSKCSSFSRPLRTDALTSLNGQRYIHSARATLLSTGRIFSCVVVEQSNYSLISIPGTFDTPGCRTTNRC